MHIAYEHRTLASYENTDHIKQYKHTNHIKKHEDINHIKTHNIFI